MKSTSIKQIQLDLDKLNTTRRGFADNTPQEHDEAKYPWKDEASLPHNEDDEVGIA